MRRRQKFQDLKAAGVLDQNPITLASKGINPFPPDGFATGPQPKGRCKKCGKEIGVGVYMHTKMCLGVLDQIPDWKMRQQIGAVRAEKAATEKKKVARTFQRGWRHNKHEQPA